MLSLTPKQRWFFGGGGWGALWGPKTDRWTPKWGLVVLMRPKPEVWGLCGGSEVMAALPGHPEVKGCASHPCRLVLHMRGAIRARCACANLPLPLRACAQPETPPLPAGACAVRRRPAAMAAAAAAAAGGGAAAAAGSNGAGMEVDAAGTTPNPASQPRRRDPGLSVGPGARIDPARPGPARSALEARGHAPS